MSKRHDKRIEKVRRNLKQVRFEDLVRVLEGIGWVKTGINGSHYRYEDPDNADDWTIVVKPHGGKKHCRPADVEKILTIVDKVSGEEHDTGAT